MGGACNYCCPVCARAENEFCGGEWNSHGTCAVGFYCNEEITRSISECIQTESPSECVHRLAPKTANYLDGVTGGPRIVRIQTVLFHYRFNQCSFE